MKTRPILFSTPMVKAVLDGSKIQTRRIIKPQPIIDEDSGYVYFKDIRVDIHNWKALLIEHAKYQIGDIMWVRETFALLKYGKVEPFYGYKADKGHYEKRKWKSSIFMPKEACRIFLECIDVRIERVQDISEEDINNEGVIISTLLKLSGKNEPVSFIPKGYFCTTFEERNSKIFAMAHWASLWAKINGLDSWNENPYVFAYDFKRVEMPDNF